MDMNNNGNIRQELIYDKHNHQLARCVSDAGSMKFFKIDAYMEGMKYFHCIPGFPTSSRFSSP